MFGQRIPPVIESRRGAKKGPLDVKKAKVKLASLIFHGHLDKPIGDDSDTVVGMATGGGDDKEEEKSDPPPPKKRGRPRKDAAKKER